VAVVAMEKREVLHILSNNEAHSLNHCCRGKTGSIAYSEYVFVAFVIQHAMCMHHNVIYGLSGSTILSTLSRKECDFQKKVIDTQSVCFDLYNFCVKRFPLEEF
jgi:hypothetical protein